MINKFSSAKKILDNISIKETATSNNNNLFSSSRNKTE